MHAIRFIPLLMLSIGTIASPATATPIAHKAAAPHAAQQRKPDLADKVAGTYEGDVTSDVRGSSHTGVTITVTRVGKNLVEVSCDYSRIPTVRIPLEAPGGAITNAVSQYTFLIEPDRDANRLDLSIDGASLIVHKQ